MFGRIDFGEHGSLGLGSTLAIELLEGGVIDVGGSGNRRDINLGLGGNDICGIDALQRNTVDLVGAGDEKQAGFELLQEDDTATSEFTGQKDQNGTGSDRRAQLASNGHF